MIGQGEELSDSQTRWQRALTVEYFRLKAMLNLRIAKVIGFRLRTVEGRPEPTNLYAEPPYPDHETVLFSIGYPDDFPPDIPPTDQHNDTTRHEHTHKP